MDQETFLQELRSSLTGKVTATVIEENIRYYSEYIAQQIRQGKSEEQIIKGLGSPRLIAKTIIEANKHAEKKTYYDNVEDAYSEQTGENKETKSFMEWYGGLPQWVHTIMKVLITVLVIFFVFALVRVLLPFVLIILAIGFIVRVIQNIGS